MTTPIKGYSKLTEEQVALINEFKEHERALGTLVKRARQTGLCDPRRLALGITYAEDAYMSLNRSIAQPEDFYKD